MENFSYHNPTKIIFGKDTLQNIGSEALNYGKKALILIGKGSVRNSGLLDRVVDLLKASGIQSSIFEGVKSNPLYQDADKAAEQAREFGADMIIAVGGGSVIDTAKGVSIAYHADHSVWEFYTHKETPKKALPLIAVLTLAATGTESNTYSVLQNNEEESKRGYSSAFFYPKVAILDPTLTYSVSEKYTVYGVVDLIAHCMEQFFGAGESHLADYYSASIIRLAVKYGLKVKDGLTDYDVRANIMWLATNALNGSLALGRKAGGDWGCHGLEHSLSVLFDIPHGAGLSIVYPAWFKYLLKNNIEINRIAFLGRNVFDINEGSDLDIAKSFVVKLEEFFVKIGSPTRLQECNIEKTEKVKILENLNRYQVSGLNVIISAKEREEIVDLMF